MADEEVRDARRLVRMYSGDVDGRLPVGSNAHVLGHVLGSDEAYASDVTSPWRRFFQGVGNDNNQTTIIKEETKRLLERWSTLRINCNEEDKLDLQRYEPSVNGVIELVQSVSQSWQAKRQSSRRGRAMGFFHKFCGSLDSHRNLLGLLPQGNEYVSIFTGTLNTIIGASVNHERVAESFSEALCLISEHVAECQTNLELFATEQMIKLTTELYSHIFLYLSEVMNWLAKRKISRLLDSMKEDLNDTFKKEIDNIRRLSERVRDLARQGSQAEVRVTRLGVERIDDRISVMERDIRVGLTGQARQEADQRLYAEVIGRELLEAKRYRALEPQRRQSLLAEIKSMLENNALGFVSHWHGRSPGRRSPFEPYLTGFSAPRELEGTTGYFKEEIEIYSAHLEDCFRSSRIQLEEDSLQPAKMSYNALDHFARWIAGTAPPVMWLDGPPTGLEDYENPMTLIAAKFLEMANRHQIPVLSYFCELQRGAKLRPGQTAEMLELTAMLYAIIRQQIELLLPQFDTSIDLSEERFRALDGDPASVTAALSLLSDLSKLVPSSVLCIIDGLHWLDDRSTYHDLSTFIMLLKNEKVRTCFTTSGRSSSLGEALGAEEVVTDVGRWDDAEVDMLEDNSTMQL